MKLLWPDTVVEENNLRQQISMLRKTLGEKVSEHRYVVTVPGRGYRFVADVSISPKDGKNGLADQPPSPIPNESRTAWQNEAAGSGNGKQRIAGAQVVPSRARRWKIVLSSCLALATFLTVVYALSTRRSRLERNQEPGRSVAVLPFKPIDNDPATAHHWYSEYLATIGHESEALSEIILARTLDPLSPVINTTLGEHLYYARRYDEAVTQLRKTLELSPNFGAAHFILGLALEQQGKLDEAISELQKARAKSIYLWSKGSEQHTRTDWRECQKPKQLHQGDDASIMEIASHLPCHKAAHRNR
jgi:tetratricopeptide (TPR) repeat protein